MAIRFLAAVAALLVTAAGAGAQSVTFEEETEPYPGVRVLERHTADPSWRIHAAYVSLCTGGVHVDARSSQETRISAATWGAAMGAQLAANGDFYRTDRTAPTVYGDAVGSGCAGRPPAPGSTTPSPTTGTTATTAGSRSATAGSS